jgi:hypothetical protein
MKKVKYIMITLALIVQLYFTSCDNRKDYFIGINKTPSLSLVKNGVELTGNTFNDSLKIGEPYSLNYFISDEEKIPLLAIQDQGKDLVNIGTELITFTGVNEGQSRFSLLAKDSFGASAEFSISFTVFRNIAPVASFTVRKIGVSSPYEYEVDATASHDKDARFNGKIIEYEYTLQNYTFSTTLSKIRYIFGSAGQKLIKVRVKDNSGDWSNIVSQYVVLN